jgi:hypothetical protein
MKEENSSNGDCPQAFNVFSPLHPYKYCFPHRLGSVMDKSPLSVSSKVALSN